MTTLRENPMRNAIIELVHEAPGLTFTSLLRTLKEKPSMASSVGNGVLSFHLMRLQKAGLVSTRLASARRRYYPSRGPWHADLDTCAFLQASSRWPLARLLSTSEGMTVEDLFDRLRAGEPRGICAVRFQLRRLREAGLVTCERTGRSLQYRATDRLLRAVSALTPTASSATSGIPGLPAMRVGSLPGDGVVPGPLMGT